jgi:large subunit ribosomal protein LX
MVLKKYEISGTMLINGNEQPFEKVIDAPNQQQAEERIYTIIGSKHRLKRNYITIKGITIIDGE